MPGFSGRYRMWPEEYALLAKYVDLTRGDYLQIGSMCGIIAMSLAMKHPHRNFVCVDAFLEGHGTIADEKETFFKNLHEHNLKNITLVEGDSREEVAKLRGPFAIVFIDANHAYDYVLADATNSWNLLSPGGFIAFHDYECVEETTRAIHDFVLFTSARLVEASSSLAVVCKPANVATKSPHIEESAGLASEITESGVKTPQGVATAYASRRVAASGISTPAQALWNQRQVIGSLCEHFKTLSMAVNSPGELALYQWAQIAAFALEFRPDLIIELGRKNGNSTCCFLEVASQLKGTGSCTVLSLCLDDSWQRKTLPNLRPICPPGWFSNGDVRLANILDFDFSPILKQVERCLVFWDAHGFDVAECVLGGLLPKLVQKNHVVLMHDMTDARYEHPEVTYHGARLWKGESASGSYFRIGNIVSNVAQAISILDFASRNQLPLHSASESFQAELAEEPQRTATLQHLLGDEFLSFEAHWLWFSLHEVLDNITFPGFSTERHPAVGQTPRWRDVWHPLRDLVAPGGTGRRRAYDALMRRIHRET